MDYFLNCIDIIFDALFNFDANDDTIVMKF